MCPQVSTTTTMCCRKCIYIKKKKNTLGQTLPVCPKGHKTVKSEHLGTVTDLCGFQGGRDDNKQDSCVHCVDFSMQMDETQNDCSCFCLFLFLETHHALELEFLLLFKTL